MSAKNEYRIDYQTQTIYRYCPDAKAYLFLCNFLSIGATRKNREDTILKKINENID